MLMRLPRPYLMTLAVLFAAGMTTYSLAWMYYIRLEPPVLLGIHRAMEADAGGVRLERTVPGSAAEAAGLQPGDVIVAVNGERDNPARALSATLFRARPGDTIRLDVAREGWDQPREIVAVLGEWDATVSAPETVTRHIAGEILGAYPLPFLIVGVVLLLQRPDDRNAWLLALVFAGFIAAAPIWQFEFRIHSALLAPLLAWWAFFLSLSSAVFYYFFATFPAASPLDRRLPWLKHGLLAIGLTLGTVFAGMALTGGPLAMEGIFVPMAEGPWRGEATTAGLGFFGYTVAGQLLGLTSLVMNAFGPPETRRRIRVIVAGSIAGLTPVTLVQLYAAWRGVGIEMLPFPVWSGAIMMLFLVPLSFAYAVGARRQGRGVRRGAPPAGNRAGRDLHGRRHAAGHRGCGATARERHAVRRPHAARRPRARPRTRADGGAGAGCGALTRRDAWPRIEAFG